VVQEVADSSLSGVMVVEKEIGIEVSKVDALGEMGFSMLPTLLYGGRIAHPLAAPHVCSTSNMNLHTV
jgi:hypothetical protein